MGTTIGQVIVATALASLALISQSTLAAAHAATTSTGWAATSPVVDDRGKDQAQVPYNTANVNIRADAEVGAYHAAQAEAKGMTLAAGAAKNGERGFDVSATKGPGYLRWGEKFVPHQTYFSLRFWVQVKSVAPGESVDIFTVKNTTDEHNADFFLTPGGRWMWDLANPDSRQGQRGLLNQWYLVEAKGGFEKGNYTVTVRINNTEHPTVVSKGLPAAQVKSLWLGTSVPKTHRQWYDDITLATSNKPLDYLPVKNSATPGETPTPVQAVLEQANADQPTPTGAASQGLTKRWATLLGASLLGVGTVVALAAWQRHRRKQFDLY